jgi:glycyl-tRNA synthetase beta subunit
MTLKERLHNSIETLGRDELMMVYEHVHVLQQIRQKTTQQQSDMALDRILKMTESSTSTWADTVRQEREERG